MTSLRRLVLLGFVLALPSAAARAQETQIRGFTDVTVGGSDRRGANSAFGIGQFDLYVTSKVAQRVSFLGETVFEFDDAGGEFVVDVERVIISYEASHLLRLAGGKHHTPLGYWNNAYHHGTLLQPTIQRPLLMRFEDEGGILPIHTTGLLVAGRDISPLHLGYDVMVGNGIGGSPTSDGNQAKSVTVALSSEVTSALQVGVNAYTDRVASGTPTLTGSVLDAPMSQRTLGGYAAYLGPRLETIAEYQHVINELEGGDAHATDGFFVYGGFRTGNLVPYVRYDAITYDPADPYFARPNARQGLVGARYDLGAAATVKLELRRLRTDGEDDESQVAAQFAIGI